MMETQILQEGAPIELIEGFLIQKDRSAAGGDPMTHHPRHALIVTRLQRLLDSWSAESDHHLRMQLPLELSDVDAPEPDAALIAGPPERYRQHHPGPSDVQLVIEVADSSVAFDRTTKQRLYAVAGIPAYWIINLRNDVVEVHEQPDAATKQYARRSEYRPGQTLSLVLGSQSLAVDVQALLS